MKLIFLLFLNFLKLFNKKNEKQKSLLFSESITVTHDLPFCIKGLEHEAFVEKLHTVVILILY